MVKISPFETIKTNKSINGLPSTVCCLLNPPPSSHNLQSRDVLASAGGGM